eukprot:473250_1
MSRCCVRFCDLKLFFVCEKTSLLKTSWQRTVWTKTRLKKSTGHHSNPTPSNQKVFTTTTRMGVNMNMIQSVHAQSIAEWYITEVNCNTITEWHEMNVVLVGDNALSFT